MKIQDVLLREAIVDNLKSQTKKGILEELVVPVAQIAGVNPEELVRVLIERERLGIDTGLFESYRCHHTDSEQRDHSENMGPHKHSSLSL